jgi:Leucine-rich repeat (LRR) protein
MVRAARLNRLVIVACGLFAFASCSDKGTNGDADDGNTPYIILDMSVSSTTDSSITLGWTATGDDADQGTASSYDLRYWYTWITPANWDSAFQVQGEPHPSPAGQKDSMCVRGLQKDSTYYFSLVVCDEADNCAGALGVQGTAFTDVVVTFADAHLDSVVRELVAKPTGDLLRSDLMGHDNLFANGAGISNLSGIEVWTTLRGVSFSGNSVTDLVPLTSLKRLEFLGLTANGIVDISDLSSIPNLEVIQLRSNSVSDLTPLVGLARLHLLDLTQNQIAELAPLTLNPDVAAGDTVYIQFNPLSQQSIDVDVPALQARGVVIIGL